MAISFSFLFTCLLVLHAGHTQREDQRFRPRNGAEFLTASLQEPQKLTKALDASATAAATVLVSEPQSKLTCHSYNEHGCHMDESGNCRSSEMCHQPDASYTQLCYILWAKNATDGRVHIRKGGCWVGSADGCHEKDRCVERRTKPRRDHYFCCCSGDMCNGQADHEPMIDEEKPESAPDVQPADSMSFPALVVVIICVLIALLVVAVSLILTRFKWRKREQFDEVPTKEEMQPFSESNLMHGMGKIHSLESKAQGKFGSVFKASVGTGDEQYVAVKVFTSRDCASWEQECKVFQLPHMKHKNILTFLGSEKRLDANKICSYWLITEYLDNGSLHDYLKSRTVSLQQMLYIADGIACGLSRLHDQLSPTGSDQHKPTVAHRDFKSKNVLLKQDLTACIADFGLALIFDQNQGPIEALGQVGTRRYMAPEVLEGAISFYRDSLLRIDMYACGLVFWELISRCSDQDSQVPDYKQPFEAELGLNPTLEEMQEWVCQRKKRPQFPQSCLLHPVIRELCAAVDDMWDQDAEARISSSCVQERIRFGMNFNSTTHHLPEPDVCLTGGDTERINEPAVVLSSAQGQRFDHHSNVHVPVTQVRPPLTNYAYFHNNFYNYNNRSTCASDSLLLKETST